MGSDFSRESFPAGCGVVKYSDRCSKPAWGTAEQRFVVPLLEICGTTQVESQGAFDERITKMGRVDPRGMVLAFKLWG